MTRRTYPNPPVHEVVLDLQFRDMVSGSSLDSLPETAAGVLGSATRLNSFSFQGGFSSTGPMPIELQVRGDGWELHKRDPTWIVRAQPARLTVHAVRSQSWPKGEYIGWEQVATYFALVQKALEPLYGGLGIRRAGLRYINRIAVEEGAELERLFKLVPPGPPKVSGLYGFNSQQSWASFDGAERFSSSLRFGTIPLPEGEFDSTDVGLLLDIDVFNLEAEAAPSWEECPEWFQEAHDVENELFEGIITDELRETFHQGDGH